MTAEGDLRRTDWRFLLPRPPEGSFRHLVLLGGPPTLSDVVLQLGVARRVSRRVPGNDPADALVLLEDSGVDLPMASRCLSPGGVLCWEIRRRPSSFFRTTPGAVRRALIEQKLTRLTLYWARPNFRRPAMYLPIGPRGVFPWYAETLLESSTALRAAVRMLVRRFVRDGGSWLFPLLPRYVVTAVSGPIDARSFATAGRTAANAAPATGSAPLVLLRGSDRYRRVIVFPFSENARHPTSVVKLWRLPDRNAQTELEQVVLGQIRSHLDGETGRTLPEPLGTARWGESLAGVESYAPGRPLSHLIADRGRPLRRKLEDVRLVCDWIGQFHRQAQVARDRWDPAGVQRWVDEPCSRYRSAFGERPDESLLFEEVRRRAHSLLGMPLPIVWTHPDLTGANVHVDGRRIVVIDWSGAKPRLPLFDFVYFAVLVTSRLRGIHGVRGRLRCFRDLFLERSDGGDEIIMAFRGAIPRYLHALGIDARFFPLLLAMNWVFRCNDSFDRAEAVAGSWRGANPHPKESYVEYVRALAADPDRMWRAEGESV